jgi:hypothetical protein
MMRIGVFSLKEEGLLGSMCIPPKLTGIDWGNQGFDAGFQVEITWLRPCI